MNKPDEQVPLTRLPLAYTGQHQTMNVHPFDPDIHTEAGIYLEHQEGCGYSPYELSLEEAERVANALLESVKWARQQKWGNPKYG